MSFSFTSLSEYSRFVSIDIGASRIKVLICSIESGELKILGRASMRQSKKHMLSGEISDLSGISESVKRTILKAAEGMDSLPEEVVVSINSTSLLYDTVGMNYVREDAERPIDMEEIDKMIASTEGKSLDRIKAKSENRLGIPASELRLITTSLTSILIDGKKISNPIGFTGKNIRLSLINFFISSASFSAFSVLVRDLGMKLVSFVPVSVALPKLIEDVQEWFESNALVDIGSSKTTVTIMDRSEIIGSFVFPYGSGLLEELLLRSDTSLRSIHIEDIMLHDEHRKEYHRDEIHKFTNLILDSIRIASEEVSKTGSVANVFLSGGIVSGDFSDILQKICTERPMGIRRVESILSVAKKEEEESSFAVSYATALAAKEIISLKKDPIVRILRYVIYRYE